MSNIEQCQDIPFFPKEIFSTDLFVPCITVSENPCQLTNTQTGGSYVLSGEFGKCYEVKFSPDAGVITALTTVTDPRTLHPGDVLEGTPVDCDFSRQNSFMFLCRQTPEYLVICVNGTPNLSIGERTILQEQDTDGFWFTPELSGNIADSDESFGNYRWTSDQVLNKLYEPYREKYPDRITRTHLGMDQTGTYHMYGYIFAPKTYRSTLFLTGGVHSNEESGYFALAKLMQLICDATPKDGILYSIRENTRFIVVPVVNVWGVSQDHNRAQPEARKRIRHNGESADLNRDFQDTTQQESKNVLNFFRTYAHEIDIAMDLHCSGRENCPMWYNFINHAVNSHVNYKTTNHMYHRLMALGLCDKHPNIDKIPGRYHKSSVYLEGRIWNEFHVPTITVEHVINSTFPDLCSEESFRLALETYGNFLFQNALFFIKRNGI